MISKRLDLIDRADIETLVADAVQESRTLDYKEAIPGGSDAEKREFLSDVSSFANATGGDLIYGTKEQRQDDKATGIPEAAIGLRGINADAEILRLENLIRDGIDPRIPGIQARAINGFPEGPVILFRIPRSWAAPHMMIYKGSSRFYSRTSRGKYELDVREIRAAFTLSGSLPEKIRGFRDDRLARIVAGETPFPMEEGAKVILHLLPITGLDPANVVDIASVDQPSTKLRPIGTTGWDARFNFDGFATFLRPREDALAGTYTQLFRSGAIEAVDSRMLRPWDAKKRIASIAFEQQLIESLSDYLHTEHVFGIQPPIFVMLSFVGVKGYVISTQNWLTRDSTPIDRDHLLLPEAVVENFGTKAETILRPAFDAVWQAAGFARSLNYNEDGQWKPQD